MRVGQGSILRLGPAGGWSDRVLWQWPPAARCWPRSQGSLQCIARHSVHNSQLGAAASLSWPSLALQYPLTDMQSFLHSSSKSKNVQSSVEDLNISWLQTFCNQCAVQLIWGAATISCCGLRSCDWTSCQLQLHCLQSWNIPISLNWPLFSWKTGGNSQWWATLAWTHICSKPVCAALSWSLMNFYYCHCLEKTLIDWGTRKPNFVFMMFWFERIKRYCWLNKAFLQPF